MSKHLLWHDFVLSLNGKPPTEEAAAVFATEVDVNRRGQTYGFPAINCYNAVLGSLMRHMSKLPKG